jgi:hypothetical protein
MTKNMQKISIVLLVLLVSVGTSFASTLHGELNGGLTYEWDAEEKSLEHTTTVTGFRFALEDQVEPVGNVHFSTKGWWDWKQKEGNISVDQLWYSGYSGDVDFKVGRQVINWGTADGFNPTNYFARLGTDALMSGDLGGEPIWAGQATYYGPSWSVTGVVVPFFAPQTVDGQMREIMQEGNPLATLVLDAIDKTKKPRGFGKNTEWAVRAETQFEGFDIQASVFSGFEPLPGLEVVTHLNPAFDPTNPDPNVPPILGMEIEGAYRRQYFAGLAAAGTVGPMGLWGEVAYGGPNPFEKSTNPLEQRMSLSVNKKYLQAVVGADYTFPIGNGLLGQGQYIYRGQGGLFAPYAPEEEQKAAHYLYGRFGYDLSVDSTVDVIILHGFTEKGGIIRPAYTHRFPNSIQLELSILGAYGEGEFKHLPSQARVAVTYKF